VRGLPSKKASSAKVNILDLVPKKTMKWKRGDKVSIVVPRARNILGKHFIDALGLKATYKIKLDEYGSAVWKLCDGKRTVVQIGDELEKRFGKKVEPLYERLAVFIGVLKREGLIDFV
jgi:hypothetical protein